MHRTVRCVTNDGEVTDEVSCTSADKPAASHSCQRKPCSKKRVRWVRGRWSSV